MSVRVVLARIAIIDRLIDGFVLLGFGCALPFLLYHVQWTNASTPSGFELIAAFPPRFRNL